MVSEELHINHALEQIGEAIETDLGEYIIQLAGETPSHIIPAIHKNRYQIADLLEMQAKSRPTRVYCWLCKRKLREKFLEADIGMTGCNFAIAETGSIVLSKMKAMRGWLVPSLRPDHLHGHGANHSYVGRSRSDGDIAAALATGQKLTLYVCDFWTAAGAGRRWAGRNARHYPDNGRSLQQRSAIPGIAELYSLRGMQTHVGLSSIGGHAYGGIVARSALRLRRH
jgi:L-lactate dehydrogenase complex protein LldF